MLADTLGGGRVVVTNNDLGGVAALRLVEELRVGSAVGTGPDAFGNVGSLAVDRAGSLYVGDYAAEEIRSFTADGTFIRVVTRRGPGPGEIPASAYPFHLAWQEPNRLWIDATPVLMFVDSLGNLGKDTLRPSAHAAWIPSADTLGGVFGRVLNPISVGSSQLMFDSSVEKLAVSTDGDVSFAGRMPLDRVEFRLDRTVSRGGARGNLMQGSPTRGEMPWAVDPSGDIWLAEAGDYVLHRVTLGGDTVRTVELARVAAPLTGRERDQLTESSPFSASELPTHRSLIRDMKADPNGWLWVRLWSPDPHDESWDIFDPCGRYVGLVKPPVPLDATPWLPHRGARLLAVTQDAFGIETVIRFRAEAETGTRILVSDCVFSR